MTEPLKTLRQEAREYQDCPLWANATQTVFGAGDPHARVMLVGEQPGDEEDKKGLPFVGPAGRLLDRALEAFDQPVKDLSPIRKALSAA